MELPALYLAGAALFAPTVFAAAEWRGPRPHRRRWLHALLAGLMWPVVLVGLAQFAVVFAAARVLGGPVPAPASPGSRRDDIDTGPPAQPAPASAPMTATQPGA